MCGYWASNTISDILAAYVPILLIIGLNACFQLDTEYSWLFLILYPPAVIPFSYTTSFLFSDDTTAQICTLFLHFIAGGIFAAVVYVLQLVPETALVGDALRYVGLVIPSFCVTHAFINSNELPQLVDARTQAITGDYPDLPPWSSDPWAWENLKADVVALVAHFILNLIIIAIIESPIFERCKDCACCESAEPRDDTNLEMDDDVLDEEFRVSRMRLFSEDDVDKNERLNDDENKLKEQD